MPTIDYLCAKHRSRRGRRLSRVARIKIHGSGFLPRPRKQSIHVQIKYVRIQMPTGHCFSLKLSAWHVP